MIFLLLVFVLIVYYQYGVSAELPTGEAKAPPVSMPKREKKEKKAPPPAPAEQTGKPPESAYFQPTKNVTKPSGPVEVVSKPSGPPPNPQAKPSGPPPVPTKKE